MTPAELRETGITSLPPTQDDLPCDDGDKMETFRHKLQMDLLIDTLYPWLKERSDGFVGGNMFVYYSLQQVKNRDFKGPDFFAALDVPKGERKSWVCWEEGKSPDVVIELLSESTAAYDKTDKKLVYQDSMRVAEYFWYDPWEPADWSGFRLESGQYIDILPDAQGRMISQRLNLALVRWYGSWFDIETTWLRWAYLDGTLIPNGEERSNQAEAKADRAQAEADRAQAEAEQEKAKANQAQATATQAQEQLQQVVRNLFATGMSIEQIAQVSGLAIAQIEDLQANR
jgi:Uma2 family endonuclease